MEPRNIWLATLGQLQIQLHEATYDTWVRDTEFLAFEDGVFKIGVHNHYIKNWLETRLERLVRRSLTRIMKSEDFRVEYEILPPKPRKPLNDIPFGANPSELVQKAPPQNANTDSAADSAAKGTTGKKTTYRYIPPPTANLRTATKDTPAPIIFGQGEDLNSDFTLETFLTCPTNQMLEAAALAVIGTPGRVYNPLFLHGGVGTGKTHLLQAMAHQFRARKLTVSYVSAETFTNDLVRAIRGHLTNLFRDHYRSPDVLIVDDVHFMGGKESTQEEFLYTFNALYNLNRPIILGGQVSPDQIDALSEHLRSRFNSGLSLEIKPPDYDTRLKILYTKAKAQAAELPDAYAQMIALSITKNVRDMEGALNQVLGLMALTRDTVKPRMVEKIIAKYARRSRTIKKMGLMDIFAATAEYHQLTLDDLLSKQRSRKVSMARHMAIYLAREDMKASLPTIGRELGGRSHTTVLNSHRKMEARLESDAVFRRDLAQLREHVYAEES